MSQPSQTRGWITVFAGLGINLALGVLYSWSVIAKSLTKDWGWTAANASIPYAWACGVFAIFMVIAGRLQDKIGPRIVATIGGAACGLGLILASFADKDNTLLMILGFGVLAGIGIGFGYGSATPPAQKWFPPAKRGMITGLVVAGFGLASVYISPLTTSLLANVGINKTFMILGIAFFIVTVILSQLLVNPPAGFVPKGAAPAPTTTAGSAKKHDYDWHEMMKTPQFYLLWLMFGFGSFAGLMIIGHMAKIAAKLLPTVNLGFILVAILAVGNASGRIICGLLSDKIGRTRTLLLIFIGQTVMMLLLYQLHTTALLCIAAYFIGAFYGGNLSLFPSATGDYFGTKNLGVNYGLVFTSWGAGGVFGGMTAGWIVDATGSYQFALYMAAALCVVGALLTVVTKAPKTITVQQGIVMPVEEKM